MLVQIAIGSALLVINIVIAAVGAIGLEVVYLSARSWLVTEPHRPKLVVLLAGVSLWVLGVVTAGVWVWALTFYWLGAFATMEEAVHFSLAAFTTLGLGDVVPAKEWRLLAGMEATNGLLNFGLLTALLIEASRQVRQGQAEVRRKQGD
ncbi:MAG: ion channel [bacterium]